MDSAHFETLALAWGADLAKWPPDRREAALAFLNSEPKIAEALLAEAGRLDLVLNEATSLAVSTALRARIISAAPVPRRWIDLAPWRSWFSAAAGAVLAASCAAGVLVGVEAAAHGVTPTGAQVASDPAIDAARLLTGPTDPAEG